MFSLPTSWSSHSVLGHAFSLGFWLAHLKSWHHSDRASQSRETPTHDLKNSFNITSSRDLRGVSDCLILDLPSPTIHWSSDYIPEVLESDCESECLCATNSQDQLPVIKHLDAILDALLHTSCTDITTNPASQIAIAPPTNASRQSILSQYSDQELVLLEFLTHSFDAKACDIDDILCLYPPGFSNGCLCDPNDVDGRNLCEVCQLTEAYLDYSFERFQAPCMV